MAKPPIPPLQFSAEAQIINTVEMHTTGEPTRIIYSGFPELQGQTLLQKRNDAKSNHDHIRRRLMLEPRGHREMYGTLLVNETELTLQNKADIGVLFLHNEGWSTMCGHATIALGRYLVDFDAEACPLIFPNRKLRLNKQEMTVAIKLHCPCGVVDVTVPVSITPSGQLKSDNKKSVSFINVDSFATGINIQIPLPNTHKWPELDNQSTLTVDFCYGGAFYCVVNSTSLGLPKNSLHKPDIDSLSRATKQLKSLLITDAKYKKYFTHPQESDLSFLYGVIVTDEQGEPIDGAVGAETGLCFFADQQVDRSPTGSGVAGRRALANAKGLMEAETKWSYHSPLSLGNEGKGAFNACIVNDGSITANGGNGGSVVGDRVRVKVEGRAYYTGYASFVVEDGDGIGADGFIL